MGPGTWLLAQAAVPVTMETWEALLALSILLLSPAEAQQQQVFPICPLGGGETCQSWFWAPFPPAEKRPEQWLVGLTAVVVFLFIVFVILLVNHVWCTKASADSVDVRMEGNPYTEIDMSKEGETGTEKKAEMQGRSNLGMDVYENEAPTDQTASAQF
ncbi:Small integral membrane protein 24 [Galemys pyrenaicus]|uniref:Small integral membrane protein 24 n=1 Tax=Galemys pyrenaicus TaxID=202257 RepID=A0A8J6AE57_GALPY|nr:Small integral membrane protein 24 [Galemys pyrenaicus]